MRASYRNPNTGLIADGIEERVTRVQSAPDGSDTVVTVCGRTTTTYRGVPRGLCAVNDVLIEMSPHHTRSVRLAWSPFDEEDGAGTDDT